MPSPFWAVVRSQPQRERFASEQLGLRGFETFLPMVTTKRGSAPLFTRYFFVRILEQWRSINFCFGVLGLAKSSRAPILTVVDRALSEPQPSRPLGKHGMDLFRRVTAEYVFEDAAGIETLTSACQCVDLAEALSAQIAIDGEVIQTDNGPKAHGAIKDRLAARSLGTRILARLGLDLEPIRVPGRPSGRGA
jgi:hypothetical protein